MTLWKHDPVAARAELLQRWAQIDHEADRTAEPYESMLARIPEMTEQELFDTFVPATKEAMRSDRLWRLLCKARFNTMAKCYLRFFAMEHARRKQGGSE